MLIRKNTKAFKTILEIVGSCRDRPDREQLIRLYITKAGDTVNERISIEAIEGGAGLFYEMNYQAVLGNLKSSNHQLQQSDEVPGLYFFHSSSNKVWDETPFEFDDAIKKEFGSLPDLPVVRKKEKADKVVLPSPKTKTESKPAPKEKSAKKGKPDTKPAAKVVDLGPKQPNYDLKQGIHFTGLERIVIRQAQLTKRDVLDYYDRIAGYLLPYLKDRPQVIRLFRDGQPGPAITNLEALIKNASEEIPDWLQTASVGKGKSQEELLLCNDKEHLLFYVQMGCLQFSARHSRIKTLDAPDYVMLAIESPEYELEKAVAVALASREILTGLQLPSFVKTDGASGLNIYIPLNSGGTFSEARQVGEYICKLVRLKIPALVTLKGSAESYGKVSMDYLINDENNAVIAPYSLSGHSANVATPLSWEEVKEGLTAEAFNHETIFNRLKKEGDLFKTLFKKKADVDVLSERLKEGYSFLF